MREWEESMDEQKRKEEERNLTASGPRDALADPSPILPKNNKTMMIKTTTVVVVVDVEVMMMTVSIDSGDHTPLTTGSGVEVGDGSGANSRRHKESHFTLSNLPCYG